VFARFKEKKAEATKKGEPPKAPYKAEPDVKGILRSVLETHLDIPHNVSAEIMNLAVHLERWRVGWFFIRTRT
jgi:hypothetical protein